MKPLVAILLLSLGLMRPAVAAMSTAALGEISAAPPPGATLPLQLQFIGEDSQAMTLEQALAGKPAVVMFADYTCHTLCGPIVDFAVAELDNTGLSPGTDFRLVVIGLDPKDGIDSARAMRMRHLESDPAVAAAAVFLTGTDDTIRSAASALGYSYVYDAGNDQFAHPAAAYVIDHNGRVARLLSGVGLSGVDLRLALIEAGHGAVGTLADRIRLLCYGYDPARGIYTERITWLLELAAGASLLGLGGAIGLMLAAERGAAS